MVGVCYEFLRLCLLFLFLQTSNCATAVVDGVSQWSYPKANIGDTIIFKNKNQYNLYIFRSKEAYNTCNFTQATALSNPNTTSYNWHPSRPGSFYFGFNNGTSKPCVDGQKVAIVITPLSNSTPPAVSPANPPGGAVSPSPDYPWPFQPREKATGPSDGDTMAPTGLPGSIPFINSNPAVPLPTGEVDSATISPLPTSANHSPITQEMKVMGVIQGFLLFCSIVITI